jgi:pimeloyl-ACP methyl ester carboxylesterase
MGTGAQGYWLFEPAEPRPVQAPLIVFSHGWGAMDPNVYGAWIEHLVRKGNIVIYPLYQDSLRTPVSAFTPNAVAAVADAVRRLQEEPGRVRPQLARFALVGHSMGGIVSANLAALAEKSGLPHPRAVMCVQPGKTWARSPQIAVKLEDLSRIPKDTLLLAVAGDRDVLARDVDARRIFEESTAIPLANKDFVLLVSDSHGQPGLLATHAAPSAPKPLPGVTSRARERAGQGDLPDVGSLRGRGLDALDFYGTWKLFDGLTDAAFHGKNREYALGNGPRQRYMGKWSDGVPVKELKVTD